MPHPYCRTRNYQQHQQHQRRIWQYERNGNPDKNGKVEIEQKQEYHSSDDDELMADDNFGNR